MKPIVVHYDNYTLYILVYTMEAVNIIFNGRNILLIVEVTFCCEKKNVC